MVASNNPGDDLDKILEIKRPKINAKPLPETIVIADLDPGVQEVLRHFGINAPELLNNYCMALEDSLIDLIKKIRRLEADNRFLIGLIEEEKTQDTNN
jgi:hypothetical protein